MAGNLDELRKYDKEPTQLGLIKLGRQQPMNWRCRDLHANTEEETDRLIVASLDDLLPCESPFACIYADPPWKYGNQGTRASTGNHYATMTVTEICEEPVADVAAETSVLFLWTTTSFLHEAFHVIDAWGFTYKSNMVWVKPQMGIGNYVRVSHEHLLIATRGKAKTRGSKQMSWIQADRTKHSRKPRDFREAVVRMCDGPRLEMYGREPVDGWTVYGNQIEESLF